MGSLYVIATPIGNLEDVTLRALRLLGSCDLLLAEDTRRTRVLLDRHQVDARPRALHAHNEAARTGEVLDALEAGHDVALVSDAGTPQVSDPGERVVASVLEAGHAVVPIPGPSACLAALAASGLPVVPFAFLGFVPRRAGERDRWIRAWVGRPETLVLFESPRRLAGTLEALREVLGDRPAAVARELTKVHEEVVRAPLGELAQHFADGARGEVTVVVGGGEPEPALDGEALDAQIASRLAEGQGAKEIASDLAPLAGLSRRTVYARALALRGEREDGS